MGEALVLEATAMGLGTCWLGAGFIPDIIERNVDLQSGEAVHCVISIGKANLPAFAPKRKPLEKICGMNEEQMSKIFEPYYTTKSSGTGLGLTVLFKIMKQHGGDVTVHSVRGEGSEFILQIPVPESERFRITDGGK